MGRQGQRLGSSFGLDYDSSEKKVLSMDLESCLGWFIAKSQGVKGKAWKIKHQRLKEVLSMDSDSSYGKFMFLIGCCVRTKGQC